jgi:hypothetical protein
MQISAAVTFCFNGRFVIDEGDKCMKATYKTQTWLELRMGQKLNAG